MKKILIASVSGIALMGLAACSDTDTTTTQGVPAGDPVMTEEPAAVPMDEPAAPAEEPIAPAPVE
jgi:hypothetical protein